MNAQFGDLEQKIETLLPRAHFVNKTAEQIISLRGKNEYECELYENVKKTRARFAQRAKLLLVIKY